MPIAVAVVVAVPVVVPVAVSVTIAVEAAAGREDDTDRDRAAGREDDTDRDRADPLLSARALPPTTGLGGLLPPGADMLAPLKLIHEMERAFEKMLLRKLLFGLEKLTSTLGPRSRRAPELRGPEMLVQQLVCVEGVVGARTLPFCTWTSSPRGP